MAEILEMAAMTLERRDTVPDDVGSLYQTLSEKARQLNDEVAGMEDNVKG